MKIGTKKILRGDVFWFKLDPIVGSEIKKTRPAVIVSNDVQNSMRVRYVVAPITSNVKKVYPFETLVQIKDSQCKVLLDQIRTVDDQRLGDFICRLTMKEIEGINQVMKLVLSLV